MAHLQTALVILMLTYVCGVLMAELTVPDPKPKPKVLEKGAPKDTTTLMECKVAAPDDDNYKTLTWKKTGVADDICTVDKTAPTTTACTPATEYQIDSNNLHNLLTKIEIAFTHAGNYTCLLTKDSIKEEYSGQLTVADLPTCPNDKDKIQKGDTKTITCTQQYQGTVEPTLKLTLSGADVVGTTSEKTKNGDITTNTLTFTVPTTTAGDLEYTCESTATDYKDECESKVTVAEPIIATTPVDTAAMIGDKDVKIHCTLVKDTTDYTTLTWTNGKKTLTSCEGTTTEQKCTPDTDFSLDANSKHDLVIKEVKDASADTYSCAIDTLTLPYKVNLIPITEPVCTKAETKVTCTLTYKGDKAPTVQWYKGDKSVDATPVTTDGKLTIDATVEDEKVIYTCRVMNGGVKAYECFGSGAPALDARLYQSTLLSLVVVWLWYQFK